MYISLGPCSHYTIHSFFKEISTYATSYLLQGTSSALNLKHSTSLLNLKDTLWDKRNTSAISSSLEWVYFFPRRHHSSIFYFHRKVFQPCNKQTLTSFMVYLQPTAYFNYCSLLLLQKKNAYNLRSEYFKRPLGYFGFLTREGDGDGTNIKKSGQILHPDQQCPFPSSHTPPMTH